MNEIPARPSPSGFRATIKVPVSDEIECGDYAQAVQNEIGSMGVMVIVAEVVA